MKIALCGSARFEEEWVEVNKALTLAGHTVYALSVFPSQADGDKEWYSDQEKTTLDLVHLSKIEESDAIVVINVGGYIGESTCREIVWAIIRGKRIYAYTPCNGGEITGHHPADCLRGYGLAFASWKKLFDHHPALH